MESLGKIFGTKNRVKIMRLFLFNETTSFDIDDVSARSLVKKTDARKELTMLTKIGFLKRKVFVKKVKKRMLKKDTKQKYSSLKKNGWVLDKKFDLINPLQDLLINSELVREDSIVKGIKKTGKIKFLAVSGVFLRDENRNIDMLVVGDAVKRDVLDDFILKLESEIGRELHYAIFSSTEFDYRISMNDKLIRDVLENSHKKLINKLLR